MADILEKYYSNHSVYKAWIVCGSDEEVCNLADDLTTRDHSVCKVTFDMLEDERPLHMQWLRKFQDHSRVLIMSYRTWLMLQVEIEVHILPEIDLVAFLGLEDGHISKVVEYMKDAKMRGFGSHVACMPILNLSEENLPL